MSQTAQAPISQYKGLTKQKSPGPQGTAPDTPTCPRSRTRIMQTALWVSVLQRSHVGDLRQGTSREREGGLEKGRPSVQHPRSGAGCPPSRLSQPGGPGVAGFTCHGSVTLSKTFALPPSALAARAGEPQLRGRSRSPGPSSLCAPALLPPRALAPGGEKLAAQWCTIPGGSGPQLPARGTAPARQPLPSPSLV